MDTIDSVTLISSELAASTVFLKLHIKLSLSNVSIIINRSVNDMKVLQRELRKICKQSLHSPDSSQINGMPCGKIKFLVEAVPWVVCGQGWQPRLQGSVHLTEKWLLNTMQLLQGSKVLDTFLNEQLYVQHKEALKQRREREARPRQLQQYFLSPTNLSSILHVCDLLRTNISNAKQILTNRNNALKVLTNRERNVKLFSERERVSGELWKEREREGLYEERERKVIFLEPSCGDGRLLKGLVERDWRCVGVEIDPLVANRAVESLLEIEEKDNNVIELKSRERERKVPVIIHDYLSLSVNELYEAIENSRENNKEREKEIQREKKNKNINEIERETGRVNTIERERERHIEREREREKDILIVVGCPPYTEGGGTGVLCRPGGEREREKEEEEDTGRDLPLQFLVHSVKLGAECVLLLLPPRCVTERFIKRAKRLLNVIDKEREREKVESERGKEEKEENESERGRERVRESWDVCWKTADDEFIFCGRIVHQPAILQLWTRERERERDI